MRENLASCFEFMKKEDIKLVNIGPGDIMDGNLKLTLGLIWTLIRRYQIRSTGKGVSTKQAMLQWLNTLIPEKKVGNFTTDWNDGRALCTLVDRLQPGLCPNHAVLDPAKGLENCKLGMTLAKDKLSIPQILKPEHLNHPKVDEMSVMTYISYFCQPAIANLLEWVQSILPHQGITNFRSDWNTGINLAALVEAISPGLFPDWNKLDPHNEIENLEKAMKLAENFMDIEPVIKPTEMAEPKVDELNVVTYISRFKQAKPAPLPSRCLVTGPGITKAFVGKVAYFKVDASRGGLGELSVVIKSSSGAEVEVNISENRKGVFDIAYTPTNPGNADIIVHWGGLHVPGSPFSPTVIDPGTFKFYGPHISEGKICKVGQLVKMYAEGVVDIGELEVFVKHDNGRDESVTITPKGAHEAECAYVPRKACKENVIVKVNGQPIPESPYELHIVDPSQCRVTATDPPSGIPVCVGKPAVFTVTASKASAHGIVVEAKSKSKIIPLSSDFQKDGSILVRYTPTELGSHSIIVTCADDNIHGSPLSISVIDTQKVTFLDSIPKYLQLGKPIELNLSTKEAGTGHAETTSSNPGNVHSTLEKIGEDMYALKLKPLALGESDISVSWAGYPLPVTPFKVQVCDASMCSAYGKGLISGVGKVEELFEFTVQAKNGGIAHLEVKPCGPRSTYAADIKDREDGTYEVSFTSYEAGLHSIEITWGGEQIPNSPYSVKFVKTDAGQFSANGDGLFKCTAKETAQFVLLGPAPGLVDNEILQIAVEGNDLPCQVVPTIGPISGDADVLVSIEDNGSGNYAVKYAVPVYGDYKINITCSGEHIPGSPFDVYALPAPKADKCHAFGAAIDEPNTLVKGKPLEFRVDSTNAGTGGLAVTAFDPMMKVVPLYLAEEQGSHNERIHIIKIDPNFQGKYTFEVKWSDEHIPGSPFKFEVGNPDMVRIVSIPDKESFTAKVKEAFHVVVDDSRAGPGEIKAFAKLQNGVIEPFVLNKKGKETKCSYTPHEAGRIELLLTYSDVNILESPWSVDILNPKMFQVIPPEGYGKQGEYVKFRVTGVKKSNAKNMVIRAVHENHNATVKIEMKKDLTAIATFTPKMVGVYNVEVICAQQHISGSPFTVFVANPNNANFKTALPAVVPLNHPYIVEIDTSKCGHGELAFVIDQSEDSPCLECSIDGNSNSLQNVVLSPLRIGDCKLSLNWAKFPLAGSPAVVSVVDTSKCVLTCPKLQNKNNVKQDENIDVIVDVSECGTCVPEIFATGPQATYTVSIKNNGNGVLTARFSPWQSGKHRANVKIGGVEVPNSPLEFNVLKVINLEQITASGEGLKVALANQPQSVTIHGIDTGLLERGQLTYAMRLIEDDSSNPPDIQCVDNGSGIYTLTYTTLDPGDHRLEILYENQQITGSPFIVRVRPEPRADKCVATGQVLEPDTYLLVKEQAEITVDSTKAGTGSLKVTGRQPDGMTLRVFVNFEDTEQGEKLHHLIFDAPKVGLYTISVEWDSCPIPKSPFQVRVIDPTRCCITNDIPETIQIGHSKSVSVDCTGAGAGVFDVLLNGESGDPTMEAVVTELTDIDDTADSKYRVTFQALAVGDVHTHFKWGGYDIQKCPFTVNVCDARKCMIEAHNMLHQNLQVGVPFQLTVTSEGAGMGKLFVRPAQFSEGQYTIDISSNGDKHNVVCTPWVTGEQKLEVVWGDEEVPDSPLIFSVCDPNKCHVIGLPESKNFVPVIGENIAFSVDQSEAGPGELTAVARLADGTEEEITHTGGNVPEFAYSPRLSGYFELILQYNGTDILTTPWVCDVPDPKHFRVTPPKGTGKLDEPLKFLITGVTKHNQNFSITALHPDHTASITTEHGKDQNTIIGYFTPQAIGEYLVQVKHSFHDIDGSPFSVLVVNPNAIDIISPPLNQAIVNEECCIALNTSDAGPGELSCQIVSLSGDLEIEPQLSSPKDSQEEVRFTSNGIGTCQVTLRWADHIVSPSPYTVSFIDPSKVTVHCQKLEDGGLINQGEVLNVEINCCEAGLGVPEVEVVNQQATGHTTATDFTDNKDGTFLVKITLWQAGDHEMSVRFGGNKIPGMPLKFEVHKKIDSHGITAFGDGLRFAIADQPTVITVNASEIGLVEDGLLTARCFNPEKESEEEPDLEDAITKFTDNGDGTYDITLTYPCEGQYVLSIDYNDQPIYQSPFSVIVKGAPSAGKCKIFGPSIDKMKQGLAFSTSQSLQFMVDTTEAGSGYLSCTVSDPTGDPVRVFSNQEDSDGKQIYYLQFDPYDVGQYVAKLFWSNEKIPDTPLVFSVIDHTRCLVQGLPLPNNGAIQIGDTVEFALAPGNCGDEPPKVDVGIRDQEENLTLDAVVTDAGVYKYQYHGGEPGNYDINITIGGCHIPGSPFKCEVLDPNQFAIFGLNLQDGYALVCEVVSFQIQGQPPDGEMFSIIAHGPQADLNCELKEINEGLRQSSFVPIEPGSYQVFVECASKHVPGSPFTVNVADPSKCQILDIPSQLQIGENEEMIVKTRGAGEGELFAQVSKEDETSYINISKDNQGLGTYRIILEPLRVGEIQLEMRWACYPIPQSPLKLSICDSNQCKVFGHALMSKKGSVGESIAFTVVSHRAGNGKLTVKAQGPSAQYTITPKDIGDNKHEAQFTPWEVGQHVVEIFWGNAQIPKSPFILDVEKKMGGDPTCHATGDGLKKATAGKPAIFTLISSETGLLAKEALKVAVAGVRGHAEVLLKDMNNGCYQVQYVPPTPGAYIATVTYFDRQIPGSPFKISCVPGPDASKCHVDGLHPNSLYITGNPIEFTVNSSEAGHGQLKVYIQGPHDYTPKVYLADDGKGVHSVKFDAMKPGRYFIVVAWSECHVPGSPFKIRVHPAADASKVIAKGPGLHNGMLGDTGEFIVDTKQAGIGTLLIRVHGLKDAFKIEANPIKADDPRVLHAKYSPKVAGDYVIFVRWSGIHVPGSPFSVHISRKKGEGEESDEDSKAVARPIVMNQPTSDSRKKERSRGSDSNLESNSSSKKPTRRGRSQTAEVYQKEKGKKLVRAHSGGHVGPVQPRMRMKKNPSLGQMPQYIPERGVLIPGRGIMIAQPMPLAPVKHTKVVVEKKITRRIDHQERSETKKSTLEYKGKGRKDKEKSPPVTEEAVDGEKGKKKKKRRFELS